MELFYSEHRRESERRRKRDGSKSMSEAALRAGTVEITHNALLDSAGMTLSGVRTCQSVTATETVGSSSVNGALHRDQ